MLRSIFDATDSMYVIDRQNRKKNRKRKLGRRTYE